MLTNIALGLLFTLVFLCRQSATAALQNYDFQNVLEVQEAGYSENRSGTDRVMLDEPAPNAKPPLHGERLARDGWTVTCDSEDKAQSRCCKHVKDGDLSSFWLAPKPNNSSPTVHWITIELKEKVYVNGIGVFARQDKKSDGIITAHEVYLSETSDGLKHTKPAAYGTWWNDKITENGLSQSKSAEKFAIFEPTQAKFVHLRAFPGSDGLTSIAEIYVYQIKDPQSPQSGLGKWGPTIDFPLVPAGAWVDPNTRQLITFSSDMHDRDNGDKSEERTLLAIWDPKTGRVSELKEESTKHCMFCPGMSMDANGRMVVTGGATNNKISIYDGHTPGTWKTATTMAIKRGYQASTTCANGNIFVIGGSWNGGQGGKDGELFEPPGSMPSDMGKSQWLKLCPVKPMLTADQRKVGDQPYRADNHGWLFGWKGDTVFQAGPSKSMNWYTVTGKGGHQDAGPRMNDDDAMCGVAVMYDASEGKILTAGGSKNYECTESGTNSYVITLKNANETKVQVDPVKPMWHNRIFHNAIILPNGHTFVAGGQSTGWVWSDWYAQLEPEMFDPNDNSWKKMAGHSIVRNYHSIGLLLPDATVFVGGGGLCNDCDERCPPTEGPNHAPDRGQKNNHFNGQIYTPQYLLDSKDQPVSKRPGILSVSPTEAKRGDKLTIKTDTDITSASLIRFGSTTHGLNTDQRRIPCTNINTGKAHEYNCIIPEPAGVAIPGYWMVFVMDAAGVPSVAATIHIAI